MHAVKRRPQDNSEATLKPPASELRSSGKGWFDAIRHASTAAS
jgi:hypothetical protein